MEARRRQDQADAADATRRAAHEMRDDGLGRARRVSVDLGAAHSDAMRSYEVRIDVTGTRRAILRVRLATALFRLGARALGAGRCTIEIERGPGAGAGAGSPQAGGRGAGGPARTAPLGEPAPLGSSRGAEARG